MWKLDPHDWLVVGAVLFSWCLLACYFTLLIRRRRRDISLGAFLLGSPMWFLTPRKFFPDSDAGLPRRGALWWFLISLLIGVLVERLAA
jgi:hypothetical protein